MALNCNLNPNLKALEDKKAELNAQMANLSSLGAGGMTDLIAKANAQKDALLGSIPAIPEVPNFQKDIDALKTQALSGLGGIDLHKKIMDLEKQWGGAIPDIGGILANFSDPTKLLNLNSLDPCGSVPNISGKLLPDGTFAPIENPPESKVQTTNAPDVKDALLFPVRAEKVTIPTGKKSNQSDITQAQKRAAEKAIVKDRKNSTQLLLDYMIDENFIMQRYTQQMQDIEADIPKAFKQRYKNKVSTFEYFLLEAGSYDNVVNVFYEAAYAFKMYFAMYERITKVIEYITALLSSPQVSNSGKAWAGTGWNKDGYDHEKLISQFIYDNAGFGILVSAPDYGVYPTKTQDAKQYVKKAFRLASNNYTAAFEPYIQDIKEMKNGIAGDKKTEFSNLLWDTIRNIFKVEVDGRNAMKVLAAWGQRINYADVSIPTADYFIPRTMGGKLKNHEDYIALNTDYDSMNTSMSAYSQADFKPHYMYKKEGTEVRTVFAKSYQEHVDLAQLGYGHNLPT